MPRTKAPENMSHAELVELQAQIEKLMAQRKDETRAQLREKMAKLAKDEGMSLEDVLDGKRGRRGKGKGSVPIKYSDGNGNTWTGRGRMPRWMVAATNGKKAKREDFLI
jgi:DNA-binding protein H-NS